MKLIKRFLSYICILLLLSCVMLTACDRTDNVESDGESKTNTETIEETDSMTQTSEETGTITEVADESDTVTENINKSDETSIAFSKDKVNVTGVNVAGVTVDKNIVTINSAGTYRLSGNTSDGQVIVDAPDCKVKLILDNVSISYYNDSAIYIKDAKKTTIKLEKGSENTIISGKEVKVTKYTESDPDASGAAVFSKKDLTISGYGTLNIGGYINNGIHSSKDLVIENGTIIVNAVNHGVKGKKSLTFEGGDITVSTNNTAFQSKEKLIVNAGKLSALFCTEGIEANEIEINGGEISLVSTDDGVNASDGTLQMPLITFNDGNLYINAGGDGIDSNGNIIVNGGMIVVDGPVDNGNGPLDSGKENGGRLLINGGTVIAMGSSGMADTFDGESAQCSIRYYTSNYYKDSVITIKDSDGNEIYTQVAGKGGSSVVFSSPELIIGNTYTITVDKTSETVTLSDVSTDIGTAPFGGFFGPGGGPGGLGGPGDNKGQKK